MKIINDFNDLHKEKGLKAIKDIIERAILSVDISNSKVKTTIPNSLNSLNSHRNVDVNLQTEDPASPPIMHKDGFHGLLGRVAEVGCENSEADPVAVCAYFFARFSATIGRSVIQTIGDGELNARPFFLVVGKSGKSRKGTSENFPKRLFEYTENSNKCSIRFLKVHSGGLSSGEGIGYALRDPSENFDANNNPKEEGVNDKRMLVIESEFANVLSLCKREGNTLSPTIRNLWDGRDIEPLTKNQRWKASNPHCTILAHITALELIQKLSSNDMDNGFLNRFILLYVSRKKLVPNPLPTDQVLLESLSEELAKVLEFVNTSSMIDPLLMCFDDEAMQFWCNVYSEVSEDREGVEGKLLARSETYARMLAMIFALLDTSSVIKIVHLNAALAWVNYWIESIRYIFKNQKQILEQENSMNLAELIFQQIAKSDTGLSRTDISELYNKHLTKKQINDAIEILLNIVPTKIIATRVKTNGATRTTYSCAK